MNKSKVSTLLTLNLSKSVNGPQCLDYSLPRTSLGLSLWDLRFENWWGGVSVWIGVNKPIFNDLRNEKNQRIKVPPSYESRISFKVLLNLRFFLQDQLTSTLQRWSSPLFNVFNTNLSRNQVDLYTPKQTIHRETKKGWESEESNSLWPTI